MLSDYARKNNIDVINLLPSIVGTDGFLKPGMTWDGIHFNAEAYKIWAREVENILRRNRI